MWAAHPDGKTSGGGEQWVLEGAEDSEEVAAEIALEDEVHVLSDCAYGELAHEGKAGL